MKTETMLCASCGAVLVATDATAFDGQTLCGSCLEERTLICHECNERIWADDNAGNSEVVLCQSCYDRRFTHCTRCGTLLRDTYVYYAEDDSGEEEELCYSCFTRISPGKPISDYYYKPEPVFHGTGSRYFGVELEIDGGGELSPNARKLINLANADAVRIYCKHDGSLDDGFEIVTHPMTLEYHLKEMPWERILREAVSMGYCSHKSGTCGLHVHVSRCAFGDTEGIQDAAIARILFFVERHWYELLKFSRRTNRQLERWAARYGYKEQPMDILDHAKKGQRSSRYTCVNLQNSETIEFRIFRGTLKYNTLIATLQMVNRICDVAINLSDDELMALSWSTFVSGCQEPELVQYLKERRLYINEPVCGEEEV